MRSICPSQMMANFFVHATPGWLMFRPNNTLPFVKIGDSGELTYFAPLASAVSTRPLNPMTSPTSLLMGNISRSRKRSYTPPRAARAVVVLVTGLDQAALDHFFPAETFFPRPFQAGIPGVGCVTELPPRSATSPVKPRDFRYSRACWASGRLHQLAVEPVGRPPRAGPAAAAATWPAPLLFLLGVAGMLSSIIGTPARSASIRTAEGKSMLTKHRHELEHPRSARPRSRST